MRKPLAPRTWRTRKDPFAAVWPEIKSRLEETPHQSASELLKELMANHPGQFTKRNLRTLQRRLLEWRKHQWEEEKKYLLQKSCKQKLQENYMRSVVTSN